MSAPSGRSSPSSPKASRLSSRRDLRGLLPREHGSWAYLLIPQIAGILASRRPGPASLWALACGLFFCAFQGFAAAQRRRERFSVAGIVAGFAGALVIAIPARERPVALLTLLPSMAPVLLGLLRTRGRIGRDDAIEVLGILATSILGAGTLLVGAAPVREAVLLAAASAAYSTLSLIWVRVRLKQELPGRRSLVPMGWNIPVSLAILAASAALGILLGRLVAGLLPGIYCARVLMPVPRRPDGLVRVPILGVQEGAIAAIFAVGLGLFLTA